MLCFDTAIISVIMTLVYTIFPISDPHIVLSSILSLSLSFIIQRLFYLSLFLVLYFCQFLLIYPVNAVELCFSGSRFVLNIS